MSALTAYTPPYADDELRSRMRHVRPYTRRHLPSRSFKQHRDNQFRYEPPNRSQARSEESVPEQQYRRPLSSPHINAPPVEPVRERLRQPNQTELVHQSRPQHSDVLKRQIDQPSLNNSPHRLFSTLSNTFKSQKVLTGMAFLVFFIGLAATLQTVLTNHAATAQVSALSKKVSAQSSNSGTNSPVPSSTKPSSYSISQYVVAPDLPRYIKIPKLGVFARVLQVGVTSGGALGTPSNVYDTAWYTGSVKPGQPGAMLIDGHVSSWTAKGVFYGLKYLKPGDQIQIQRGDGAIFNYQVVKSQIYPDGNVNMQSAITPVTPGKPGLNLITCTGQVKPGTSEFNERIVVYAEQV